ncbi:MAG: hypothetical protein ACD_48C00209G0001 [uncultured bacterium]|nr:MAG: hypothetical protein ACD_48C00209G0001 [uncultured bacterium]
MLAVLAILGILFIVGLWKLIFHPVQTVKAVLGFGARVVIFLLVLSLFGMLLKATGQM